MDDSSNADWALGDLLGMDFPTHAAPLETGGAAYLTKAFRASGVLSADNSVTGITECRECLGGGTGRKLFLSVTYEKSASHLHEDLFVKFSRDFDDPRRDRVRYMMESEVQFAFLSREPGFPIAVPACVLADFNHESGSGILITERIPYGQNGVEHQHQKCLDREMPAPRDHYEALVSALGRLAGAFKAGRLPARFGEFFPLDADAAVAADRIPFSAEQLLRRVDRMEEFARTFPQLLPDNVKAPSLFARLGAEAPRYLEHEETLRRFLFSDPAYVALCHWNANVDNGWFWRDASGVLQCGLMDWGRVGQMNLGQALYGGLSGADPELWDHHLASLLDTFIAAFESEGGPRLDHDRLRLHLHLVTATMGLAWIMDAPALVQKFMPDLADAESAHDPRFSQNEHARVWLHMLTMFLNQWDTNDFGAVLDQALAAAGEQT